MFEQLQASSIQDRVSDALYKWRGIADWPEAEATVAKWTWTPDVELGGGFGNYQVLFSYPTPAGLQTGTLGINGYENAPPYATGDVFTLRYHPKRPSRYYYANELSRTERLALLLSAVAVGAAGAFLIISLFP